MHWSCWKLFAGASIQNPWGIHVALTSWSTLYIFWGISSVGSMSTCVIITHVISPHFQAGWASLVLGCCLWTEPLLSVCYIHGRERTAAAVSWVTLTPGTNLRHMTEPHSWWAVAKYASYFVMKITMCHVNLRCVCKDLNVCVYEGLHKHSSMQRKCDILDTEGSAHC